MSSMRNAVARRPHRERAQPTERKRLGLLEKHKDYSERAKDYNKKKATLKSLRHKAADRNEDEFYFGMMSRKGPGSKILDGKRWTGTASGDRGNKTLDVDTVRLLKTQDMGYIRTMKQVALKEVARLEEQLVLTRGLDHLDDDDEEEEEEDDDSDSDDDDAKHKFNKQKAPRKITFFETEEERQAALVSLNGRDNDDDDEQDANGGERDDEEVAEREKSAQRLKKKLDSARRKLRALSDAEQALEEQRAKMAKTATSGGLTRRGKKIMYRARKK